MKLFSTKYDDKEVKKEIDSLVGKSYNMLKSMKLGGTGSHRMIINKTSHDFSFMLNESADIVYGSIEIRPKGIIFHVVKGGLKSWAWVIPYFKLNMYHCNGLTVYSDTSFLQVLPHKFLTKNQKFVSKLVSIKQSFNAYYTHPELDSFYNY